jgi:hypothetical protein
MPAAALAVGRSVDQNVTSLAQPSNREVRTKSEKIHFLPIFNIVLHEFSSVPETIRRLRAKLYGGLDRRGACLSSGYARNGCL